MPVETKRCCGVLLHITSLPGPGAATILGRENTRFIDVLSEAGQSVWQMLPLHPPDRYRSPYSALSAFAGDADLLKRDESAINQTDSLYEWRRANTDWIEDWALFKAIREVQNGIPWYEWPHSLRDRDAASLELFRQRNGERIEKAVWEQFQFENQWSQFHSYASARGIKLFGDMPFFVALDSADVWANQHLFNIGKNGRPTHVAGVPPDYFSRNGQRWGNPLYRWVEHERDGYRWWKRRLEVTLRRFDLVRIDHFRAIAQYWAIPERNRTARKGTWKDGPGRNLLKALQEVAGPGRLVAEDLGYIPPGVIALRREFGIPGMAVLQFAFDSADSDGQHHPDNIAEDVFCYSGTHDNDTTVSWFEEAERGRKPHLRIRRERVRSLMRKGEKVHQAIVRTAMETSARATIFPIQDLLGLGGDARMNFPGRIEGNWQWRLKTGQTEEVDWEWFKGLTEKTGRLR
jgi:4-alpha-glucanotransferase